MSADMSRLYIGLVHYPVYNKNGETVTSAITNLDIHDIARLTRTYGLGGYFIINPDKEQQRIASEICAHWTEGFGSTYNSARKNALNIVKVASTIKEAEDMIEKTAGVLPLKIVTSATIHEEEPSPVSYSALSEMTGDKEKAFLLLFGTGWGLAKEVVESSQMILPPLSGGTGYNHLSVRSAVSIIIDRLASNKQYL